MTDQFATFGFEPEVLEVLLVRSVHGLESWDGSCEVAR